MKKYGHVWILSYVLIYLPWFAALQQNVGKPYHVMHTTLDDLIPFNEYFIVPYLLWFLYVAAAIAYFFFTSKDDYYRLCTFLFTGMTISLLVCTLYPNGTDFRPAIDPDKNIFCFLVAKLWSIDPCINVFPSIHAYNSIGVHISICRSQTLSKNKPLVWASGILMVSICIATVCLKQHSILDVFGSMLMAMVIYPSPMRRKPPAGKNIPGPLISKFLPNQAIARSRWHFFLFRQPYVIFIYNPISLCGLYLPAQAFHFFAFSGYDILQYFDSLQAELRFPFER